MISFNVQIFLVELPLRHTFTISRSSRSVVRNIIIRIESDGFVGWGEAAPNSRYNESIDSALYFLREVEIPKISDYSDIIRFLSYMNDLSTEQFAAKAGIEMAVLDWYARKHSKPVHQFFYSDSNTGPVTSLSVGIDDPDILKQKIIESGDAPVLKIKLGTDHDKEIIENIRQWTDKILWIDANEGWSSTGQVLNMLSFLESNNVRLIEQPVPAGSEEILQSIRGKTNIPMIADESFTGKQPLEDIAGYYDGINIKLMKVGGMIPAYKIMKRAREMGLKIMIGCMLETSLANTAAAIMSMGADYADIDGPWLLEKDPFKGFQLDDKYHIIVDDDPGLGVALIHAEELHAI